MGISLNEKIKKDRYTQKVFTLFPGAYLVGGYIRDLFLGREAQDRDYAIPGDPLDAAKKIQEEFGGKLIPFKDNLTVRIVIKNNIKLDVTQLISSIEEDLGNRDFTMNSLGYSRREGLIDPFDGLRDIRRRLIRATREQNLLDDPVRLLRAFRFQSELGWAIESDTMKYIRSFSKDIKTSAAERITFELFSLMNGRAFKKAIGSAKRSGVLNRILCLNNNKINININKMLKVHDFLKVLPYERRKVLKKVFVQDLNIERLILVTCLLHGYTPSSNLLILSNKLIVLMDNYRILLDILHLKKNKEYKLFKVFMRMKEYHVELAYSTMNMDIVRRAEKYVRISRNHYMTGDEIIALTGANGPEVGRIMNALKREIFLGRVKRKRDASAFVRSLMKSNYII